ACARLELSPVESGNFLRIAGARLDWGVVLELASRHGLRPLLYRHLDALAPAAAPRPIFVELWGCHESLARRNAAMAAELLCIVDALEANAIPCLPYKGPALAQSAYGDLALREFGDLDILVAPADLMRARTLVQALGYTSRYPLAPPQEAALLRSGMHYHLVLDRSAGEWMVELHWRTDPDYPVERCDDPQWWETRPRAAVGAGRVRAFSTEELLLVLCLHGSKHFWASLGWLVDVAEMIRQEPRIDWAWIIAKAHDLAGRRRLALGLHLAHRLLDAPLPQEVAAYVRESRIGALADGIVAGLFTPRFHPPGAAAALRLNLAMFERPAQRLAHCMNVVFSPTLVEWSRWPLPRPMFFLYLPLRMARLTTKYLGRWLGGA
ncbi:MAG: nucleotidyltransferase family protein, partial [Usitatibacter sp.]